MNKVLLLTKNNDFARLFISEAQLFGGADWRTESNQTDGYQLVFTDDLSVPSSQKIVYLAFDPKVSPQVSPLITIHGSLEKDQVRQLLSSCFGFGPIRDQVYHGRMSDTPLETAPDKVAHATISSPPILPFSPPPSPAPVASSTDPNIKSTSHKKHRRKSSGGVKGSIEYLVSGMTLGVFTLLLGMAIPAGSLGVSSLCARQSIEEVVVNGKPGGGSLNCSQLFSRLSLATALPLSGTSFFGNIVDAAKTIDYATKTLMVLFDSGVSGLFANSSKLDLGRVASVLSVYSESIEPLNQRIPGLKGALTLVATFEPLLSHYEDILGFKKPVTYMVLFQNNMELRPTGGFIGSFALIDVAAGKISNWKVYDVYDADGQLPGYVRPPEPIFNHLREAQWWLRDSNWDPDFPTSARRATWFLDKSLDRQVRGVVAINLEVLREILVAVGPIELEGGEVINADNFYRNIQDEVHESFFPGSTKKKDKLTEVANSLMGKLSNLNPETLVKLLGGLKGRIDSKDFQLFFPDPELQPKLYAMGVSGQVREGSIGFVEANLGVNKSNQYIDRSLEVSIEKREEGSLIVTKKIAIENNAKSDTNETLYKSYVRALAPVGAKLLTLSVFDKYGLREPKPDITFVSNRVEFGALVETQAGKTATLEITFELPVESLVNEKGESGVWLFKQSGVSYKDLKVEDLTLGGVGSYNTSLASDKFIKIKK